MLIIQAKLWRTNRGFEHWPWLVQAMIICICRAKVYPKGLVICKKCSNTFQTISLIIYTTLYIGHIHLIKYNKAYVVAQNVLKNHRLNCEDYIASYFVSV